VWYRENRGAVLATSIDKYCYVTIRYLPPFFSYRYRIRYTQREEVQSIAEIRHPAVRECLASHDFHDRGIEIQHNADLPARIGLGSSSTFTVCLLNVQHALKGNMVTRRQLALEAIRLEQDRLRENVGSQDQTIAAFGGFNKITFDAENEFSVEPVTISAENLSTFHRHLMLFYTGLTRSASDIAEAQVRTTPSKKAELTAMYQMVNEALSLLNSSRFELPGFARLMHEAWLLKRSLTDRISNPLIDEIYGAARRAGAMGGKLLGAGGGGCILLLVRRRSRVH
jgi:D-glycero-alpha-D-manno-heptose-7-phosphate kinase